MRANRMNYPAPVAQQVEALIRAGRKAPAGSRPAVLAYYLANERAIRDAKAEGRTSVGCAHGFRKAAIFSSKAERDSLHFGEDAVGLKALVFNGVHPAYKNGGGVPRPFRLVNGRLVRVKRVASH